MIEKEFQVVEYLTVKTWVTLLSKRLEYHGDHKSKIEEQKTFVKQQILEKDLKKKQEKEEDL